MIRDPRIDVTLLHMFLSDYEVEMIDDLAADQMDWERVNQPEGPFRYNLKPLIEESMFNEDLDFLAEISEAALDELRRFTGVAELGDKWDAMLLFYPQGCGPAFRRDRAPEGMKSVRLNVLIKAPKCGKLMVMVDDPMFGGTIAHHYESDAPGQALIFSNSKNEYSMASVVGQMLVLSIGVLVPA